MFSTWLWCSSRSRIAAGYGHSLALVTGRAAGGGTPPGSITAVTQPVGPAGGDIEVNGGAQQAGGVTVSIPAGTIGAAASITVTAVNAAPSGVAASGGTLLAKTVEVVANPPVTLNKFAEVRIRLTAAELGGRSIQDIQGGVVVGTTLEPRPTRVIDASQGILGISADHFSKFSVITVQQAGPAAELPGNETTLSGSVRS